MELAKTLPYEDYISENLVRQDLKFRCEIHRDFFSNGFFFNLLKCHIKKVIVKIPRCSVWSSETLESKALIPNVMKLAHKKINERLRNQPLQGGNLLYITQMYNSWMIQMTRPPFYV